MMMAAFCHPTPCGSPHTPFPAPTPAPVPAPQPAATPRVALQPWLEHNQRPRPERASMLPASSHSLGPQPHGSGSNVPTRAPAPATLSASAPPGPGAPPPPPSSLAPLLRGLLPASSSSGPGSGGGAPSGSFSSLPLSLSRSNTMPMTDAAGSACFPVTEGDREGLESSSGSCR